MLDCIKRLFGLLKKNNKKNINECKVCKNHFETATELSHHSYSCHSETWDHPEPKRYRSDRSFTI